MKDKIKSILEKNTTLEKEFLIIIISLSCLFLYLFFYDKIKLFIPNLHNRITDFNGNIILSRTFYSTDKIAYKYAILISIIKIASNSFIILSVLIGFLKLFFDKKSKTLAKIIRIIRLYIMSYVITLAIATILLIIFKYLYHINNNVWILH